MRIRLDFENKTMVFDNPIKVLIAKEIDTIKNNLEEINSFIEQGYYAAGYLSYESAEGFNSFNKTKDYRNNQLPLLYFGIYDTFSQPIDEQASTYIHKEIELKSNTSLEEYNSNIRQIKQEIIKGNTYQTNYTIQFHGEFYGDINNYYTFLQKNNKAGYCAHIQFEDINILSISPELFFKIEHDLLTSKPMKGTAGRGVNLDDDNIKYLELFSEKNQAENMMIVDLLRNDLSKISLPGSVEVTKLFEAEKYPTVWQLTSTIQSKMRNDINLFEIFQALFPCGSITGAPKASTMQIIANIEKEPREIYCGTIGYIEPFLTKAVFNIPIRTLTMNKEQLVYGVGGGVTWDSTDHAEYNEILAKTAILNKTAMIPDYLIESILLENGHLFLLDEHLLRLSNSAKYFNFKFDYFTIENSINELANLYPIGSYKIRVTLNSKGEFYIESANISYSKFTISKLSVSKINSNNINLYHKTSNRSHFPKLKPGMECLMFNERMEITEFVNGNIVVFINGKWITPKINSGLLAGTMRDFYLKNGDIGEDIITLNDLTKAEKIAFINSVRKWVEIELSVFDQFKLSIVSLNSKKKFSDL